MTKRNPDPPVPPITVHVTVDRAEGTKQPRERPWVYALSGLVILCFALGYLLASGNITIVLAP
jgi:hypothetical protein